MKVVDQAVGTNLALRSARPAMPVIDQRSLDTVTGACIIFAMAGTCGNTKGVPMRSAATGTMHGHRREIQSMSGSGSCVTVRCAKLLLNLVSRLIAALDCRPLIIIDPCHVEFARVQLHWYEIHETMHIALTMAFNAGGAAQSWDIDAGINLPDQCCSRKSSLP